MQFREKEQPGLEVAIHDAPEPRRLESDGLQVHQGIRGPPKPDEELPSVLYVKEGSSDVPSGGRRTCGLKKLHFWIALTVLAICMVGGVVGGVIGTRSKNHSSSGSSSAETGPSISSSSSPNTASTTTISTTASTSTSSAPFTTATSGLLALDCPNLHETKKSFTVPDSTATYAFKFTCQSDATGTRGNGPVWNTTSVDGCVDKCAEHNRDGRDTSCGGVVWNGNLTSSLTRGANCYLKMGTVQIKGCTGCSLAVAATLV
ncbi:hypothetical protein PG995_004012 [Apiospora arundinis]|uniref:Eukaryotic aspartyl protease n=1 Tax=Apiospora arundinis TaxID=335852 RepID=A0ABR2HQ81_9PEZI